MTKDEFLAMVAQDASMEVVVVTRTAHAVLGRHAHPFTATALVLRGELQITEGDATRLFRAGEVFHLPAGCEHAEQYGPTGATYLAARSAP